MGFLMPKGAAAPSAPTADALPPVAGVSPALAPQGTKPKKKSMSPTFLGSGGSGTEMQSNVGGKTLLGA